MARSSYAAAGWLILLVAASPATAGDVASALLWDDGGPALRTTFVAETAADGGVGGIFIPDADETAATEPSPATAGTPSVGRAAGGPDPYTPLGVRLGQLLLYPSVTLGAGFSRGVDATGLSLPVTPALRLVGDFDTFDAELGLSVSLDALATPPERQLTAADAALALNVDLPALWTVELDAGYAFALVDSSDPALPAGYDAVPAVHGFSLSTIAAGPVGPVALRLSLDIDRSAYGDASVGGVPVDQGERDFTTIAGAIRVASGAEALFSPFAEATVGRRFYDQPVDTDGFLQSGTFAETRIGVALDSAPVLTSEASIGYHWEFPDDPALARLNSLVFDVNTVWSPRETFRVTVGTGIALAPDPDPTAGGTVTRSFTLRAEHDLRDNLVAAATAELQTDRVAGTVTERSRAVGTELAWQVSRSVSLSGGYTRRWLWNVDPAETGTAGEAWVTAEWQH